MIKKYLCFIVVLLYLPPAFPQQVENTVAQIGSEKISSQEFKLRFELSPYIPSDKNIDPDSIKYDFLYSLIAEKLWAKEAEDLGLTNTDKFNFIFKPLEDMFVRDALLKLKLKIKFHFLLMISQMGL